MTNPATGEATAKSSSSASPTEVLSWAFFDFANSGYTTVVLTTIYSAYFVSVVAAGVENVDEGRATFLWTLATAIASFCVLLAGPIVGAIADHRAWKKRFLAVSTVGCVIGTALLAMTGPGDLYLAMGLVIFATIAFAAGENLIASFLPEIATTESMGRVSGYGWSIGYFGGLLTLGSALLYVNWATAQGHEAAQYVPVTLLMTAIIFAITATPTFVWLRERATPSPLPVGVSYWQLGFSEVFKTLREATHHKDLFRFLGCLTLYQSGVATVIVVAAIYAQSVMGFDNQQLIVLIMVVNLTAAAGAFAFGYLQDRVGSVPSLMLGLLIWLVSVAITYFAKNANDIWLAGNLMGLAMGATQAGGRALIGQLTPVKRSAEFFGLWGLASRAAAIIGPLSYGLISQYTHGDHRLAMLCTGMYFVAGLGVLLSVDQRRGEAARYSGAT